MLTYFYCQQQQKNGGYEIITYIPKSIINRHSSTATRSRDGNPGNIINTMCFFDRHCKHQRREMAKVKCQYKIIVVKVNHKKMTVAHHSVDADGTRRLIHALSWSKLKFYNAYDGININ